MYMRYRGWGVGHLDAKTRCSILQEDPVATEADLETDGDSTAPSDPDNDDDNSTSDESESSEDEANMPDQLPDDTAAVFLDGIGVASTGTDEGADRVNEGNDAGRGDSGIDDKWSSESGEDGDLSEDSGSDDGTDTGSADVAYDQ